MSTFDLLVEGLLLNEKPEQIETTVIVQEQDEEQINFFNVLDFQEELRKKTAEKNKSYHFYSENITAYDLAGGCIRSTYYRIKNIPCKNYSDNWLPVHLRSTLGTAVHDFIQGYTNVFTETEVALKVPSKRISARIDALIGKHVLCEIKSCGYTDFSDIIKKNQPRTKDFYQAIVYKYLLENHLQEIKEQQTKVGNPPVKNKYDIKYIQFIYICHELISGESDSLSEAVKYAKNLKQVLNSKKNNFWFIHTVNLDLSTFDTKQYEDIIKDKAEEILKFLTLSETPPLSNKYIDTKQCFFCLHKDTCKRE